ncbi:DUF3078 domain-containing protein [Flavobacterium caseinilyticum]|uniref:DUF3078 domain-containing protein n=1 Tax=Flavobacterium caseinilyticum TaxID=2541732 RepID=A0A4R5AZ49_9FLAO|nr:DUF3078 domain-containing protein [Flavobacterium caseinilyticum]TDD78491.1 DUF3078 domain-containing protein [Flavobacterium caseinilyticum]
MKLLSYTLLLLTFTISFNCLSQESNLTALPLSAKPTVIKAVKPLFVTVKIQNNRHYVPLSYWTIKNSLGFDISEVAFVNWSAGGTSSISGLIKGKFHRVYNRSNYNWSNELLIRYGLNKQERTEVRKTDDAIQLNSTFGYRQDTLSNWYHSAKFNFNTQFTNGYAYPNTEKAISKLFAPAYIFMGIGAENVNKKEKRTFYISPFTFKTTLVLDQRLANQGAFGVPKATYDLDGNLLTQGEKAKMELGFLVSGHIKKEIFKNITLENRLSLYSDYVNRFGNIDVDYDLQVQLVVNQYVKANVGAHVIYDDDIKSKKQIAGIQVTQGPKTQIRQAIGVGIEYIF